MSRTPLEAVETWGGSYAAAAVDPTGVVHRHGDTTAVRPVASVTKLATALAVLLAVEEGAIALDDAAGPPGSTVTHLLCHASGLDVEEPRARVAPGERRIYSNAGYDVLAGVVTERTGIAFADYLGEGVLAPLGMQRAHLAGSAARDLHASVEDVVALAAEWRTPRVLHPDTVSAARQVHFDGLAGVLPGWGRQTPCPWGLGPEIRGRKAPHWTGESAAPSTYGHFGAGGSFMWTDPVAGVTCVVVGDLPFGAWARERWPGFSDAVRSYYG